MQVTEFNDVKVYNLSAGKSLPQFLEEAQKRKQSLRYNSEFRRRLDLIQDFEFNIASTRVRVSPDGEFIAATGIYPPEVKLFEARELGMKCSRGLNSEVVDFLFLGDDWKKLAFLCEDRSVEFHAQYGRHHKLRVPKAGRTLCYDAETCGLFVGGSSAEVVRLDLEGGTFLSPLALQRLGEVNALAVNPTLPVLSCAGNNGLVESYDLRESSKPLRSLQVVEALDGGLPEDQVTCCAYSKSGMQFAAGTSSGLIRVYDVRSSRALCERDHMNGFPIRSVTFHTRNLESAELLVASADERAIKVWSATSGAIAASVESKHTINQVEFVPGTGLFFAANDNSRIGCFFVPALGLAPKWCSFLDSITEELEESTQKAVFDDYKFVTADDLEQLGAKELVGSKFLQPYMHGYFMDQRLHQKLKAAMDPFAFEEYRKQRVRQKLDAKRTMRTRVKTKVDVNPRLHQQLQMAAEEGAEEGVSKKRKQAADKASRLLADKRFEVLFADPDFAIEERGAAAEKPLEALSATLGSGKDSAPTKKAKKTKKK